MTELPLKDPSDMLQQGKKKNSFLIVSSRLNLIIQQGVGSSQLLDKVIEQVSRPKIPLPPFLNTLKKCLVNFQFKQSGNRGWYWSSENNSANEIIYYLLFNSPYKTGIVSLELDAGQYGQSFYF